MKFVLKPDIDCFDERMSINFFYDLGSPVAQREILMTS